MRKLLCLVLALLMILPAAALSEEDIEIEEITDNPEAQENGGPVWHFPVALEDMNPDFVKIANKHYLLDKSFVCKPLVKIKSLKLEKDKVTRKSGDMYVVSGGMELNETCAAALAALSDAARADGQILYLKSAYRSFQTQKTMYYNRLKKNNGKDDGWVSKPGASDHQTGLGCDVVPKKWKSKAMNEKMAKEPECVWMAEHCQEYGFIIRYPEDKQDITEINYEPWHLRYVGIPAATYIMENGLCLEEFTEQMQEAIREFLEAGGDPQLVEAFIQTPTEE
ncbi:MAG: M15 family metallopeptidase [Clostridiales bacterium]|nr:M15 family metallopeptidase [Clostridiales bacterium]